MQELEKILEKNERNQRRKPKRKIICKISST